MSVIQREETVKSTFKLEGLHCASCAAKIEQAAAEMEGVSGAFLDFASGRITIDSDKSKQASLKTDLERLAQSIEPGVKIKDERFYQEHTHQHNPEARRVLIHLGTALALFGAGCPEALKDKTTAPKLLLAGFCRSSLVEPAPRKVFAEHFLIYSMQQGFAAITVPSVACLSTF